MNVTCTNGNARNGILGSRITVRACGQIIDQFTVTARNGVHYCLRFPSGKYGRRFAAAQAKARALEQSNTGRRFAAAQARALEQSNTFICLTLDAADRKEGCAMLASIREEVGFRVGRVDQLAPGCFYVIAYFTDTGREADLLPDNAVRMTISQQTRERLGI